MTQSNFGEFTQSQREELATLGEKWQEPARECFRLINSDKDSLFNEHSLTPDSLKILSGPSLFLGVAHIETINSIPSNNRSNGSMIDYHFNKAFYHLMDGVIEGNVDAALHLGGLFLDAESFGQEKRPLNEPAVRLIEANINDDRCVEMLRRLGTKGLIETPHPQKPQSNINVNPARSSNGELAL
jgi:hypothetical protein